MPPADTDHATGEEIDACVQRAFSETADPAAYVPRAETEQVLETLGRWCVGGEPGPSIAAIVGNPGLGKTLLLKVVEQRLLIRANQSHRGPGRPSDALYLPYAGVGLEDLALWVHGLLGRAAPPRLGLTEPPEGGPSPGLEALLRIGLSGAEPFYLLIDDADSIPEVVLRELARGLPGQDSPLRLLLALGSDSKGARVLAALHGHGPLVLELSQSLGLEEAANYLIRRLARAGAPPDLRVRIDRDLVRRLHALSGGQPRALHALAVESLTGAVLASESGAGTGWMGQPIDEE
jgi:hypothetical protein